MATQNVTRVDVFPEGTSVGAYPKSQWSTSQLPPSGAPPGSPTSSATVTGGVAALTGLADATNYYAGAQVGGVWRYLSFRTPNAASAGSGVPAGGTTGQQLTKNSNADGDAGWATGTTPVDASTTAKGIAKVSKAPVSATNPIAVGANDERVQPQFPVAVGNLGTAQTVDFASIAQEIWLGGTLNGNLAVTVNNPVAGSRLRVVAMQDGTGSWTLTIAGQPVTIPTTPTTGLAIVLAVWLDATTFRIESAGVSLAPLLTPFTKTGAQTVAAGAVRFRMPFAAVIESVAATVGTAPTGAALICDVNKNGTTIFTTQANRPTIAVSTNASSDAVPDVTAVAAGDYITVDVDQVGSTVAGSDLCVILRYHRAP